MATSSSFAGANHRPMPISAPASVSGPLRAARAEAFPPAPKSVRVVSVFDEGLSARVADQKSLGNSIRPSQLSWGLILAGITAFSGLALAAISAARIWNQLGK